jgi:hypothetical protein
MIVDPVLPLLVVIITASTSGFALHHECADLFNLWNGHFEAPLM